MRSSAARNKPPSGGLFACVDDFIDALWLEEGLSTNTLAAYRRDLTLYGTWLRERGISDFDTFLKVHPEFVMRCMQEIRVIDVNRETLRMFAASDKKTLLEKASGRPLALVVPASSEDKPRKAARLR